MGNVNPLVPRLGLGRSELPGTSLRVATTNCAHRYCIRGRTKCGYMEPLHGVASTEEDGGCVQVWNRRDEVTDDFGLPIFRRCRICRSGRRGSRRSIDHGTEVALRSRQGSRGWSRDYHAREKRCRAKARDRLRS